MSIKIGIPSALFYFEHKLIWNTFFTELGAEIVPSGPTNRAILDQGITNSVAEACLPVKIFHGHVESLIGKADYILIPRYTSISEHKYICPKFGGLPDLVRNSIEGLPAVIDAEVNFYKGKSQGLGAAREAGSYVCPDQKKIARAYKTAMQIYYEKRNEHLTECKKKLLQVPPDAIKVALAGHMYVLEDSYINMNIRKKLEKSGAAVFTPDMKNPGEIRRLGDLLPKKIFWDYGAKAVGFSREMLKDGVDGVLYISSFGCGIDAFVTDIISREVKDAGIPFCIINIDEQTGEAGVDTRLEAFMDMLERRRVKLNDSDISTSGERLYNSKGHA